MCSSEDMISDRQTHRHTDRHARHNTPLSYRERNNNNNATKYPLSRSRRCNGQVCPATDRDVLVGSILGVDDGDLERQPAECEHRQQNHQHHHHLPGQSATRYILQRGLPLPSSSLSIAAYNWPTFLQGWLGSRVVSVLDSCAEGPGSNRSRNAVGNSLGQTVHTHCASVHQAGKLVAALLRVAGVTAGLAESNGSLPPGL